MPRKTKIDLVTYDPKRKAHILIAVEQGPWTDDTTAHLQRLQDRLYDYVVIAVDGLLATKYPESFGKSVIIQLDCYDVPRIAVEQFFFSFSEHVHASKEIQAAIKHHGHIKEISFEINWQTLTKEN